MLKRTQSLWNRFFGRQANERAAARRSAAQKARAVRRRRSFLEALEDRRVLALAATVDGSGNLTVTDTDIIGNNNQFTISTDGTDLIVADAAATFISAPSGWTLGAGSTSIRRALAGFTGSITVDGALGNDTLTIDLSAGDVIPAGNITFNGGNPTTGPGDKLVITGGSQGTVTYNYTNASDGNIISSVYGTIIYTGLEPIANSGTASDIIFNLPAGGVNAILEDDGSAGNNITRLRSNPVTFETTDFASPTNTLTINGGSGSDTITLTAVDSLFKASVTVDGGGGTDTINQDAALTLTGGLGVIYAGRYNANQIARVNVDGTGLNANFYGTAAPLAVAVDAARGKVYYSGYFAGTIGVMNLDGTGANDNFVTGLGNVIGLEVNEINGDIYIADATGSIRRVGANGTGLTTLLAVPNIYDVDIDVANNKLYYCTFFSGIIGRANLDGTSNNSSWLNTGVAGRVDGIGLDLINQRIFWSGYSTDTIGRANLDGTGINNNFITGFNDPEDVEVDNANNLLFFSSWTDGRIGRSNLDGSGVNMNFATGVGNAWGLDLGASSYLNLAAETVNINGTSTSVSATVTANDVAIAGAALVTTTGTTTIVQQTAARPINLGSEVGTEVSLTDTELDKITAGTIQIGNASSGAITVSGTITSNTNLSLTTGSSGIVSTGGSLGTTGATVTMNTNGPIGTSANRIQFANNTNTAQQNVVIGSTNQASSVFLDGLGDLTLGNITGNTANTTVDVTARTNLVVVAGATINSGTGSISLGADLSAAGAGDNGSGTLTVTTTASVISANTSTSAITLRGADIDLTAASGTNVSATGAGGGMVVRSSQSTRPMSLGGTNSAVSGINLTDTELTRITTLASGTVTIGDSTQTGDITFTTATVANTAGAATTVIQATGGAGKIVLDDTTGGTGTALNGNGGVISLTAGTAGITSNASNAFAEISTTGATVTMNTTGPIGTAANRIQFADNTNTAQQNVVIGSINQPSSVFLDGLGSFTLGSISGGTSNATIDVTARNNLVVAANATIISGTSFNSLGADLTAASAGDNGTGTLTVNAGASVYGGTINLRGADVDVASTANVGGASTTATTTTVVSSNVNDSRGLAFDSAGNMYVAGNANAITKVSFSSPGVVNTITPNFAGLAGSNPDALAFDSAGNLYVTYLSGSIGKFTFSSPGVLSASNNSFITGLNSPLGLSFDSSGNLFIANSNGVINKATFSSPGVLSGVTPFVDVSSTISFLQAMTIDPGNNLYVAGNDKIVQITPAAAVTTIVPSGAGTNYSLSYYQGTLLVSATGNTLRQYSTAGALLNATYASSLSGAWGTAQDASGNLWVVNWTGNSVSKVTPPSPAVTTLVTIRPSVNNRAIDLGTNTVGQVGLTDAELDRIVTSAAGTIQIGNSSSGTITVSAPIDRTAATIIELTTATNNNIAFSGSGSLNANGGNVTLTTSGLGGISSGTATTDVLGGTLTLSSGSAGIGSSANYLAIDATTVTASSAGGSLNLAEANSATIGVAGLQLTLQENVRLSGNWLLGGAERISNNALVGISSGTFKLNGFSETVSIFIGSVSGAVVNDSATAATLTLQDTGSTWSAVQEFGGTTANENNFAINKTGTGAGTLSGDNTFAGAFTIGAGSIKLGHANGLGATSPGTTISSGGTLDLNGFISSEPLTISGSGAAGLGGALINSNTGSPATVNASVTLAGNSVFGGAGNFIVGGIIDDGASTFGLTKEGAGVVTLFASNAFNGSLFINAGDLRLTGSLSSTTDVLVQTGGTLSGTGTVNNLVTVNSPGNVSPGSGGVGTLNINRTGLQGTAMQAGSNLNIEIGGNLTTQYDRLAVNGTVFVANGTSRATLNLAAASYTPQAGDQYVFVLNDGTGDAINGNFLAGAGSTLSAGTILTEGTVISTSFLGSGLPAVITYLGGDGNDAAILVGNTTITLSGTTLTIADAIPLGKNDDLRLKKVNISGTDYLEIHDPTNYPAGAGFIQVNANTVRVLWSSINNIVVNTLAGNDKLTIDLSGVGSPIPAGGVSYDGGAQTTQDVLALSGGTTTTVQHNFVTENSGSVVLTGALAGTISYQGIEPITDNVSATNRIFSFTGALETIDLTTSPTLGFDNRINSSIGELVDFLNPTDSLQIITTAGTGNDIVNITSLASTYRAATTITTDATDNVNLGTNLTLGSGAVTGSFTIAAANAVNLAGSINTDAGTNAGAISITGPITLGANVTLDTDGGGTDGNISLTGTVNAEAAGNNRTLAMVAGGGTVTATANVGASQQLQSYTISSATTASIGRVDTRSGGISVTATTITLGGNLTTDGLATAGPVTLTGNVSLGAGLTIDTDNTTDAAISITGTVNGAQALVLNSGTANSTLGSAVGGTTPLTGLTVTAGDFNATAIGLATAAALSVTNTGTASAITGIISGSTATVTKGGTGTLALNGNSNYTGSTTINGGVLSITNANATGTVGPVAINSTGVLEIANVTHNLPVTLNAGGTLRGTGTGARENGIVTVANGAVTIGTGATATDVLTLGDAANDLTGGGATAVISVTGSGVVVQSQSSNLTAGTKWNINGGKLSIGAEAQLGTAPAAPDASHITLQNAGTLRFTAGVGVSATPTSVNRGLTLGTGGGVIDTTAGISYFGGPVAGGTGLTKEGAGTFVLRSAGTQTIGNIVLNAGRFFFSNATVSTLNAGQLGTSAITINSGATLSTEHTAADFAVTNAVTINSGGILTARRIGTTTYSGLLTLPASGTAIFNLDDQPTGAITASNASNARALTGELTIQVGTNNATVGQVNLNHLISGTGFGLTKTGTGTFQPTNAASSYTGNTTVLNGTLLVNNTVAPSVNSPVGNSASAILVGDTTGANGAAFLTNAAVTVSRGITIRAGSTGAKVIGGNAAAVSTISGTITLSDHVTLRQNSTGTVTISSLLADSGGARNVTKDGTGTVSLTNVANTYTGTTTISAGVLQASVLANGGVNSSIGAATNAAANLVLNGGTLRYVGPAASTDRLFTLNATGGTIEANGASNAALTFSNTGSIGGTGARTLTLSGTSTGANTFNPTLGDSGGATTLSKGGAGTWVVTNNANSYTGVTNVTAGILRATQANSLGGIAGGTIVSIGATLELNGTFTQAAEPILLSGEGVAGVGALNATGIVIVPGRVGLLGSTSIGATASNTLTLNGTFHKEVPSNLTFVGAGNVTVNGAIGNADYTLTPFVAKAYAGVNQVIDDATVITNDFNGTTVASFTNNAFNAPLTFANAAAFNAVWGSALADTFTTVFHATLTVSTPGTYSFAASNNDDGAAVWLKPAANASFVTADRLHNTPTVLPNNNTVIYTRSLAAGTYTLLYAHREGTGGEALTGRIQGPILVGQTNATNLAIVNPAVTATGTNHVVVNSTGTVTFAGANTYSGATTVNSGTLLLSGAVATLGSATGGTFVESGATLALQGGAVVNNETLTLNGLGAAGQLGALVSVSGANSIAATSSIVAQDVSLGEVRVATLADTLTINAPVNLRYSRLSVDGAGNTIINGIVSGVGANGSGTPIQNTATNSQVFSNVAEASAYTLLYELAIPNTADFDLVAPVYKVDNNVAFAAPFDRVAYYLELENPGGGTRYVYASMNAFTANDALLNVPNLATKIFQQIVVNMNVFSNAPGIVTGTGIATGNIEFWPNDYSQANAIAIPNASAATFDFGDTRSATGSHGSMQIHNYDLDGAGAGTAGQTLFAYNNWNSNVANAATLGIGNSPSANPDYTSTGATVNTYTVKNLVVLARQTTPTVLNADNALVKLGNGTLTLAGGNSYNGTATITGGTVIATNATALGADSAGTTIAGGATLDVRANIGLEALTSVQGAGVGGLGALVTSVGSGTVGGAVTLVNATSIGGAGALSITGDLGGAFALTKLGLGTTVLAGTNSYTTTTVSAGTLQIGAGGATGTLGSGAVTNDATLAFNRNNALAVGNGITGTGIINQIGTGTTTLTGTNSAAGGTNVTAGALVMNGTLASDVEVATPGSLFGNGTITGIVSGDGTFSPGTSAAVTMTIVGTFMPSGTVNFEVNSPWTVGGTDYDRYLVTGSVDLTGATITFSSTTNTPAPSTFQMLTLIDNNLAGDLTTAAASPADGDTVTIGAQMFRLFYNGQDGNNVVLVDATTPTIVYVEDNDWDLLTPGTNIPDGDFTTVPLEPVIYGVNAFNTIQAAIAAVASAGTVIVNPGTYAENVVLSKPLSLLGARRNVDARGRVVGAPSALVEAIIAPASGVAIELQDAADNTTINGFAVIGSLNGADGVISSQATAGAGTDNLDLLNNYIAVATGFTASALYLNRGAIDADMNQNEFVAATGSTQAVFFDGPDLFHGLSFTNNNVLRSGAAGNTGIFMDGVRHIGTSTSLRTPIFTGNLVTGHAAGWNMGRMALENALISENTITGNTLDGLQGGPRNSTITRNTISNNARAGLRLTGFGGTGDATRGAMGNTIAENFFSANGSSLDVTGYGDIRLDDQFNGTQATNSIFNNSLTSAVGAFNNETSGEVISFSGNWWNTSINPESTSHIGGVGAADIDYTPWLNSGTDTDGLTAGFQGNFNNLHVDDDSAQFGATGRISEGINLLTATGTVQVQAGTYVENVSTAGKIVTVAPGTPASQVLLTGNLTLDSNDTLALDIDGLSAATQYDNFVVTGVVTLGGATLAVTATFTPAALDSFTLINNDSNDAVSGIFNGLAPGSLVSVNGVNKKIFYQGNDGNDVILAPETPVTAYVSNTLWTGFATGQFILDADQGTTGDQSALFNYNAFEVIADALSGVTANGTVIVNSGSYAATVSSGTKTLEITGPDAAQAVTIAALTTAVGQNVVIEGSSTLTVGDATDTTIAGMISGSGSLTKLGTGALTLSGVNSYSGGTVLGNGTANVSSTLIATASSGGFVLVTNNSSLGSGVLTARGSQLRATTGGLVLPNAANLENGGLRFGGGNDLEISGGITLVGTNRSIGNYSTNRTLLLSGMVTNGGFDVNLNAIDGAANNGTIQLSGQVSGAGGLILGTDFDNGLAILSGNNNYSGAVTVNDGILSARHSNALGTTAGGVSVVSGATLQLQGGITIGNEALSLAGSGEVGQTGALVNVQDTNTYGGLITLNASATIAADAGLLNLDVASGDALTVATNGVTATLSAVGGSIEVKDNIGLGDISRILTLTGTSNGLVSGSIGLGGDAGVVNKTGTGTWTLSNSGNNWSTGGLNVSGGTLVVGAANVIPDGTGKGDVTVTSPGTLDVRFNETINGLIGTGTADNSTASPTTLTVGNANATSTFSGVLTDSGSSTLALLKTGTGTLTLSGNSSYTGGTTLSQGVIVAAHSNTLGTAGTVTINDAATGVNATSLLIDSSTATVNIGRAISVANQGSGVVTIGTSASAGVNQSTFSGAITLAKDVTLQGAPSGGDRTEFTGGIGGTGNVTIGNNSQRVIFATAANTYVGSTTVNAGSTLQLGDTASAVSFIPDASLVTVNGTLNIAKGNNNETIDSLAGSGTVQGHPSVTSTASSFTIGDGGGATFSGLLSNGGAVGSTLSVTKLGAGTQTFSTANTYSGGTLLTAGTLVTSNSSALGTGTLAMNGGTLNTSVSLANNVTLNSTTNTIAPNGNYHLMSGQFSGTGGFIVANGGGTPGLELNNPANNFAGNVTINASTILKLSAAEVLPNTVNLTNNGNLRLDTSGGATETISGLTGTGAVWVPTSNNSLHTLSVGANDTTSSFAGTVGAVSQNNAFLALTKIGNGTFTLTNAGNVYSGVTNVDAGTLLVDGAITGTGLVHVNSPGTLGGIGAIAGAVSVNSGGTLNAGSPVTGTESLATGDLTVNVGGTFTPTINGTTAVSQYDQVIVTGIVTLTGSTLLLQGGYSPGTSPVESFMIIDNNGTADAVVGTFASLPEGSPIVPQFNGVTLFISYAGGDGNDVVLYSQPTVNGTPGADTLVLRRNNASLNEFSLNGAGFVQVTNTLPFTFNGLGGTDLMWVDTTAGDPIATGNTFFNGEHLRVQHNTTPTDTATYVPSTTAGSGTVAVTGYGDIIFTGTSNVDFVNLLNVTVQTASIHDSLTLADGSTAANGGTLPGGYDGTASPSLTVTGANAIVGLRNVTNSTIDTLTGGTNGDDTIAITSGTGTHGNTNLTIATSTGTDIVTVSGALTVAGNLTINSQNIAVNATLTAGAASTATLNAGTGAITTSGSGIDVVAQILLATATTGINLDTTVVDISASNSGVGAINIDETNGANVVSVSAANGSAAVTSATGDLNVTTVSASTTVTLTATAGSITDANVATNNITAVSLTASAATGIDLDTTITTLTSASVTGLGAIDINDLAGGLMVTSATTADGAITLNATGGDLTLTTVTAVGTGRNILATTTTSGNVLVDNVTALGDDLQITSVGSITEVVAGDLGADLTAGTATLSAVSGIGATGAAIEVDFTTLTSATVSSAGILNLNDLAGGMVVTLATTNDGSIFLTGTGGDLTLTAVTAGGSGADVTASTVTSGNILVNLVNASGDAILLTAVGNISETASDGAVDLMATAATLSAGTGIGSGNALETTLASLTATNATLNNIEIAETDAISLVSITQTTDADTNDILISAGGTITIGTVAAGATSGDVTLSATVGSIVDDLSDTLTDVTGDVVILTAVAGVGQAASLDALDTSANSLDVSVTSAGLIHLLEFDAVTLSDVDTNNGPITIVAGGTMTATDVASLTNSDANDITLTTTAGGIAVGVINAGAAGDAFLTAATAITDNNVATLNITADDLVLLATTGVGTTGDLLETTATNLESTGGSGGVFVANSGALVIGNILGPVVGLSATGGDIVVTTTGLLTVTENVTASGAGTDVTLTAFDAMGAGENFILNGGVTISSGAASVTLNAGDNADILGNVTSGGFTTINVDFGDAESFGTTTATVGDGGTLTISGAISTPSTLAGGAYLNGADDYDTFIFNPQTSTAFFVDGEAPTGGTVGDVLQMNVTVPSNPNLTVPGGPTLYNGQAYDGAGSGVWTFDPLYRNVHFTSIEDSQITGQYHLTYDNSINPVTNLVIMLDGGANPNEKLQFRDNSIAGTILYQTNLAPILSVRVLGGTASDIVTINDVNGLPSFAGSVPGTIVGNHPSTSDTDGTPLPEFFFDAGGGTNVLNLVLNQPSTQQQFAFGNGTTAGTLEAEIQSTNSVTGLNAYVRNVGEVNRTGNGGSEGGLTVFGTTGINTISIADNTLGETRIGGGATWTSFDFSGNNYSALTVNPLAGNDLVDLVSFGSGQNDNWPITLNGDADSDTIRVRDTSGNTGPISLNGNAGSDFFQLYDGTVLAGTVNNIAGLVTVDGSDGNVGGITDTLTIIDNSDPTADTVLISPSGTLGDYAVEGINDLVGNDVILKNIDTLNYTGTLAGDNIDGQFRNTATQHDINTVSISGWTGADQFLLFTTDQKGGSGAGFTPTGVPSGVGQINLYGDALNNPNAGDGNDIFGEKDLGISGTGFMNVGLLVSDAVRLIRPSTTTAIAINGGEPTGPQPPLGDILNGDKLNLDISALPNTDAVVVSTFSPGTVVAPGIIASTTWAQIEDMNLVDQGKLTNVQMGDLFARTTPNQDLVQFGSNPTTGNPYRVRLRINATMTNYSASNKTIIYGGGLNDTITQANLTIPAEFYGEDGDDNISGAIANDWLVGGVGHDRINGGRGNNVIWGDDAPTSAVPQPQDGAVGGDDILSGLEGADVFYAGAGNDQVSAGPGIDYINGGQGDDVLDGFEGDDRIYGGAGNDTLTGSTGNDLLMGNTGNDLLYGNAGNDVLIGGTGNDLLDAGNGNDLIITGSVDNEVSSRTSQATAGNYSQATYTAPGDNDLALLLLLTQWGGSDDYSALEPITHDTENDDLFGGLGNDAFCWEANDVSDTGLVPPDYTTSDQRIGPT